MPAQTLLRNVTAEQEEGGVFGPDEIAVMTTAFGQILLDLKVKDRDDPVVEMIAKQVIEIVHNGERDPLVMRKQILGLHRPASEIP